MRKIIIIMFFLITSLISSAAFASQANLSDAESTAQKYMSALFKGDFDLSFSLMDQDRLMTNFLAIQSQYEKAVVAGNADEFASQFGNIENFDDLLQKSPKDFFILLSQMNREKIDPGKLKLMAETRFEVIGSNFVDVSTANVDLKITLKKANGSFFTEKGDLLLTLKDNKWVVVENG